MPSGLSNLKSKGDKLDVDKLVLALVDFSKLGDIAKNDTVKKMWIMLREKILMTEYLLLLI